jgi:hypothetical protein
MIAALSGSLPPGLRVLVATRPVDFRRGADGLAARVQSILQQDPFSGTIFVFRSKRSDRGKLLVYDGTGLVLIWKRLEGGTFKWPPNGRRSATGECVCPGRRSPPCSTVSTGDGWARRGFRGPRWPGELRRTDSPLARDAANR